jgi:hypothetical protein
MRKVAAGLFSSIDGVVEAPNSPVVAGGGRKRLFADDAALTKFELADAEPTSSGALIATYRPIR